MSEAEFEKYVYANQELLDDVYIIHRQIRTGNRQGIPDMLGVDQEGQICIIEMKNIEVGEEILPQILGYLIWAERNPDSIKAIWLESHTKPDNIPLDWDHLELPAIVIAPGFQPNVQNMLGKIDYPIELVQIQRFVFENEEFLSVEVLEQEETLKPVTTKVLQSWGWEAYAKDHGEEATRQFRQAVEKINEITQKHAWTMVYKHNKFYTGFVLGNRIVYSVYWGGTHAWNITFKVPPGVADSFRSPCWEFQRYDKDFHEAVIRPLVRDHPDFDELEPLYLAAYKHIAGNN
ncbi:MAG: hypothetical protein PHQ40_03640 [Anaerolineaceae bacterium]|nr:hypothetical protein [Anaerolineaceae bacterium]